jgi:hypothetical protein
LCSKVEKDLDRPFTKGDVQRVQKRMKSWRPNQTCVGNTMLAKPVSLPSSTFLGGGVGAVVGSLQATIIKDWGRGPGSHLSS